MQIELSAQVVFHQGVWIGDEIKSPLSHQDKASPRPFQLSKLGANPTLPIGGNGPLADLHYIQIHRLFLISRFGLHPRLARIVRDKRYTNSWRRLDRNRANARKATIKTTTSEAHPSAACKRRNVNRACGANRWWRFSFSLTSPTTTSFTAFDSPSSKIPIISLIEENEPRRVRA
jgi:hypothetical protein